MSAGERFSALGARLAPWLLVAACVFAVALLVRLVASALPLLLDYGYPDSYILYDVLRFQRTGVLYHDLALPPYQPSGYSPLIYLLLALPGRVVAFANPYLGPRLVVLASFAACLALTVSLARTLVNARWAGTLALLLASTIGVMKHWILQLRADFPGAACGLLAVRLLLVERRWAPLAAGLCAGLAVQFKFTFVAALGAGGVWLLARRRWRDLAGFVATGLLAAIVPYVLWQMREPRMLAQITLLSPVLVETAGYGGMVAAVAREPVLWLGLAGVAVVVRDLRRWGVLMLFAALSLAAGSATALQVGANNNYWYEGLFALVPLAAAFALRLGQSARRQPVALALVLLAALAIAAPRLGRVVPRALHAHWVLAPAGLVRERNAPLLALEHALRDLRVISVVPRVALMTTAPPVTEPFLMSLQTIQGSYDPAALAARIRAGEYEVAVTWSWAITYRGVPLVTPVLAQAVEEAFTPYCLVGEENWVVQRPRRGAWPVGLAAALEQAGCRRVH